MLAGCYLATFKAQWPSWSLNNIVLALLLTENFSWSMGCWHRCAAGFRRWKRQIVIWPNKKLMTSGILRCCALSRFSIFEAMALAWWHVCVRLKSCGTVWIYMMVFQQHNWEAIFQKVRFFPAWSEVFEALSFVDSTCAAEIWTALAIKAEAPCSLALV